jgi:hypothetical protein
MKLRIHENSLRLRLTQGEVTQFRRSGRIDAAVHFGRGRMLSYSVESLPDAAEVSVHFDDKAIRILLPSSVATQWTDSMTLALQSTGEGLPLELLIEKDFQCLHRGDQQEPERPVDSRKPASGSGRTTGLHPMP